MPETSLAATDVRYVVGQSELVAGISIGFSPGELTVVLGPNGAGKSTLLSLLAGELRPSSGQVTINGIDTTTQLPGDLALERSILTRREPADIPYTASQVVAMGRFPHRRDPANTGERDQGAIAAAMRETDTTQYAGRRFSTLSSGEQTRVSLARVIAQTTPIILLDEPTTALDVAHQERIMRRTVDLSRAGRTVVAVLHDLNSAAVYADRVVLMDKGRLVADGTPSDVLQSDRLSAVYDQPMRVLDHPFRERPLILLEDRTSEQSGP